MQPSWATNRAAFFDALSPEERRTRVQDARASNPRGRRLVPWADPRGTIHRLAGAQWTIVEEAYITPELGAPTVYQVAINSLRGALILGPFRAPPAEQIATVQRRGGV